MAYVVSKVPEIKQQELSTNLRQLSKTKSVPLLLCEHRLLFPYMCLKA